MFADATLSGWLAEISADLPGSCSALEALRDDALYKSTYFTFTLLYNKQEAQLSQTACYDTEK